MLMEKQMKHLFVLVAAFVTMVAGGELNAATVGFYFNESNALVDLPPGDTFYGEVVLEMDVPNEITITVNPFSSPGENDQLGNFINSPLVAGPNFGIQEFALNSTLINDEGDFDNFVNVYDIVVPSSWNYEYEKNISEFGLFEFVLAGTGSSRQDPLVIEISPKAGADLTGYEFNSISDFVELNAEGYCFVAHIADFTVDPAYWEECQSNPESAYFAIRVTPEPSMMVMVGFGLLALLRKKKS